MEFERAVAINEKKQNRNFKTKALKVLHRRVPITDWIRNYSKMDMVSDMIAGITLGLTLIPQSIAYSSLARVPPHIGLNSAFVGCFVYVIFGTIKEVSIGPTSLMSFLTAEYTRDLSTDFVVALCFFVGCCELLMGIFKLGFLVNFISVPVTSGFQTATSIMIIVSQLKGILGVRFKSCSFLDNVYQLIIHIKETKVTADFSLGVSCIVCLLLMRKLKDITVSEDTRGKRVFKKMLWFVSTARNFIAVVVTAFIAYCYEQTGHLPPFEISKSVDTGLPPVKFPPLMPTFANHTYTVTEVADILSPGYIVIPIVAVLANVAIAKAFITGGRIDSTQEMITLSFCNILGSFVQAMPTCGAFTRSAVASASGVRTPFAGLYSGALTLLALTFLTPYFHLIPRATLSAVLISAVLFLIDWQIMLPLWKYNRRELFVVMLTILCCLGIGIEIGLFIGICSNLILLVYVWASPQVLVERCKNDSKEYLLVTPAVGMFFPATDKVCKKVIETGIDIGEGTTPVVFNCVRFADVDVTSAKAFCSMTKDFKKREQPLVYLHVSAKFLKLCKHFGCKNIVHCNSLQQLHHILFNTPSDGEDVKKVMEPIVTMATIENGKRRASQISLKNFIPEVFPLLERSKIRHKSSIDITSTPLSQY